MNSPASRPAPSSGPGGTFAVPPPPPPQRDHKDLIRVFNTAMVATRDGADRDFSKEIFQLMELPAFKAILTAVHHHSKLNGVPEALAAEEIIRTFRQIDQAWADYVYQQGVNKIQGE